MESHLPHGWQMFRNPNGQVIYANMATGQFQDTPPMVSLALPPGWTQTTNASGRTVYANQSLGREQFEFPEVEAQQAQAPSAPPVDPRTERVKTQYYPHVHPFSKIPPADIIDMLYHPLPPPDLTPDEVDLILNNYVGTAIRDRRTICGDDADILSCAKKLFTNNAGVAQNDYSFKLPIEQAYYICDVPFRWNPANEYKKKLDDNPTAFLAGRLFPLNDNTVRWLCSTHTNPIPSTREALESRFMLDFFDAPTFRMSHGKTAIQVATANRDLMSTPQFIAHQATLALQKQEQKKKRDEEDRIRTEQQRILDTQRRAEQAREEARIKAEFEDHMCQYRGGLKSKRKQSKRKQSKRKQTKSNASKRKQTKRKQSKRKQTKRKS
jgi:hypothetical protein